MYPKISIVIPTYNRDEYLEQALISALEQDYNNLEIIIADNASTDSTLDILSKYKADSRVKVFRNDKNLGMVNNWRRAVFEYVTGDFFLILSDDDYLIDSSYLSKAAELIERYDDLVLVYANGFIKDEQANKFTPLSLPFDGINEGKNIFLSRGLVLPQDFILCNVLFHVALSKSLDCFNNSLNVSCDSELFLKLVVLGEVAVINKKVSVYRRHDSNLISKVEKNYDLFVNNWLHILEPIKFARENECFNDEENERLFNFLISREIKNSLLKGVIYHRDRYHEIEKKLINDAGWDDVEKVKQKLHFKVIFFCARNFPLIFTKLYIFRHFFLKCKRLAPNKRN